MDPGEMRGWKRFFTLIDYELTKLSVKLDSRSRKVRP